MGYAEAQYVIDEILDRMNSNMENILNKLVIRGYLNTHFVIRADHGYLNEPINYIITENDPLYPGSNDARYFVLYLPRNRYSVTITLQPFYNFNQTVVFEGYGETQILRYSSGYELLQDFTSNSTFTVPENVYEIFVDGVGGGGGGGGGRSINDSDGINTSGAGGGGSGYQVSKRKIRVVPLTEHNVIIGTGGGGGSYNNDGKAGTSTVLGTLLTLSGGRGGGAATYSSSTTPHSGNGSGGIGGNNGGKGGYGFRYASSKTNFGLMTGSNGISGGRGGFGGRHYSTYYYYFVGGGGGGGSIFGSGGNGAGYKTSADSDGNITGTDRGVGDATTAASNTGGGGGGGGSSKVGAAGGSGRLRIYRGLIFE